jgi:hypothetical protein
MSKKKYKNTDKQQNLSEPTTYQTQNRINIFNSFEEASKKEIQDILEQPPIDRLRQTVELILRVYNVTRESLKERKSSNRIKIIRSE